MNKAIPIRYVGLSQEIEANSARLTSELRSVQYCGGAE
jgi:hypothetical protein